MFCHILHLPEDVRQANGGFCRRKGDYMRFRERMYRFFAGRYGWDRLNWVLLWTAVGLMVLNLFFSRLPVVYFLLYGLSVALYIVIFCRMMSRNIPRRQAENRRLERMWGAVCGEGRLLHNRFRDRKTHVFRRCRKCKAILRLPRKRGRHAVTCPRCGRHFKVFILFSGKQKIE